MDAIARPDLARNVGVHDLGESGHPAIVNLYLRYDDDDSKVSPAARSLSRSLSRFSNNALSSSSCRETRSNEREGKTEDEEERLPIITLGGR